jgi:hypothetical protein
VEYLPRFLNQVVQEVIEIRATQQLVGELDHLNLFLHALVLQEIVQTGSLKGYPDLVAYVCQQGQSLITE